MATTQEHPAGSLPENPYLYLAEPLRLAKVLWPDVGFYSKQREIIESVWRDAETYVPAANEAGKDFVAARLAILFFLTHQTCRIVTTSVTDYHLNVLWGEIHQAIRTSKLDLVNSRVNPRGPLLVNKREIRRYTAPGEKPDEISYIISMVAADDGTAALQGHHADFTLGIIDEGSGIKDSYFSMFQGWADHILSILNPWPTGNFIYRAIKGDPSTGSLGGDVPYEDGSGYYRKIIQITADDIPNVRLGKLQTKLGYQVTGENDIPGVKTYKDYLKNLKLWDPVRQQVCLKAEFPEGREDYLIPKAWLERSAEYAKELARFGRNRCAKAMGVDSAMGGDNTCWITGDEQGALFMKSLKTPNTAMIPGTTAGYLRDMRIAPEMVLFDYGGGGKQHVDRMRQMGLHVQAVMFGEPPSPPLRRYLGSLGQRKEEQEERGAYRNRRAEMYGLLRQRLDPDWTDNKPFAIPAEILYRPREDGKANLFKQLTAIPLWYDSEGRLYLPPKSPKSEDVDKSLKQKTMIQLVGCSPDESDALALLVFKMFGPKKTAQQVRSMV